SPPPSAPLPRSRKRGLTFADPYGVTLQEAATGLVLLLLGREQTDEYDIGTVEWVTEVPILLHEAMIGSGTPASYRFSTR
ncbi:hypothetical protein, partial [Actinoplanes sp. NPDC026670]|uniref:hypothetical protein n=1 Tax=Actinoplanes sp. NPDC026670 TaxID=3154700 RepID=UPI0034009DD5